MFEFDLDKIIKYVEKMSLDELTLFLPDVESLVYVIEDCIEKQSKFSDKDFV